MNDKPYFFKQKHTFTEWFLIGLLPIIIFGVIVDETTFFVAISSFCVIFFVQNLIISFISIGVSFTYWASSLFVGWRIPITTFMEQALALNYFPNFTYVVIFSFIAVISGMIIVLLNEDALKYSLLSVPIIQFVVDIMTNPHNNYLLLFLLDFTIFWGIAALSYAIMRGFLVSLPRIFYAEKFES